MSSYRLTIRMTAPLVVAGLLLLAAALGTAWYVQALHRNVSEILESNVASMRAAEELEITLREVRSQLDRFLLSGDPACLEAIPSLRQETDRWLARALEVATTEQEQEWMGQVRAGYDHFFRELDEITRRPPSDGPARQRMRLLIDRVLTEEILRPAHAYLDYNEKQVADGAARNREAAGQTVVALLALGVCGPVAGLLAGLGLARRVNHSLVRLSLPVRDAAGRLNEVVGPVTLAPGWGLEELESVLHRLAEQAGAVVERLRQTEREALRAEQLAALGQIAAGFAHEVRNPLMSMKLLVQSAARQRSGLAGRGLAVLEEEIGRLEALTSTFLDFARPPTPRKETFDARVLVEETAELVAGRAGQRDVRIDCELPPEPVWVEADAAQVRQVALNLLLNALDAVGDGGSVRARLLTPASGADDRGWVEVAVEDDGPGLPAGLGQDIFSPFVSTKPTGLGLGLAVCKRIAEAHGGEVAASDRPGGGALFTFRLPGSAEAAVPARKPVAA